jgi:hypothetical protein
VKPFAQGGPGGVPIGPAELRDAYPHRANGHTLYPFRRLFIVAVKP